MAKKQLRLLLFNEHHMNSNTTPLIRCLLLSCVFSSPLSWSQDTDTQFRIEQRDALSAQNKEQAILEEENQREANSPKPDQTGKQIDTNDVNQVAKALHLAVRYRQWVQASQLLEIYRRFEQPDLLLLKYADGAISRAKGDLEHAQLAFEDALALQPNFMPAQLELARVLFESNQNRDALNLFNQIKSKIPSQNPRAAGVIRTIDSFTQALVARDSWNGSVAIGGSFNDNLNNSSESYTCLVTSNTGQCLFDRVTPKKEKAYGIDFEASINKRFSLSRHHGIHLQGLTYGTNYANNSDYNEHTSRIGFGYSFHDRLNKVSIGPSFELSRYANSSVYFSSGVKLDWLRTTSQNSALKFEFKADYQDYIPSVLSYQTDWQLASYLTYWYQFNHDLLLFGGIDWTGKQNKEQVHAYELYGGKIGLNSDVIPWVDLTFFGSFRHRDYQGFNSILSETRRDKEQNYALSASLKDIKLFGVTPSLVWNHKRIKSNVDWLYTYQQNEITIKFTRRF